jgi:hypothetical protein
MDRETYSKLAQTYGQLAQQQIDMATAVRRTGDGEKYKHYLSMSLLYTSHMHEYLEEANKLPEASAPSSEETSTSNPGQANN